jgi:O-antigen/teichoic acid export membrane protein
MSVMPDGDATEIAREDPIGDPGSWATPAKSRPAGSPLIRNVLSNWSALGSAVLYSLLITPTVIRALDKEAYGVWSFLNALMAYSGLFYLGLGAALVRYTAHHYAVGDRTSLNRLVSVVLSIFTGLGVFSFVAGAVLAPQLPHLLLDSSRAASAPAVSATLIVLAARVCLMFVGSVFSGVLFAQGRMDLSNLVGISGNLARLFIVPIAVSTGNPLLALAFTFAVTAAVEVAALGVLVRRLDPLLRMRFAVPSRPELRMLYGFGLFAFLLQVSDRVISYTDTTVIGFTLGAGDVALYALPLQLVEYGRFIVFGIVSVMLPHLIALHATGQVSRIRHDYIRLVKITALIAAFVNVNLVWLGPEFLRLWVGPKFSEHAAQVLLYLGVAGFAQAIAVQSQIPFCMTLGKIRFAVGVLTVEAAVNLGLSIVLARAVGIVGVAVATAIPAISISGLFLPIYVARQVGAPLRKLLRQTVVPVAIFLAAIVPLQILLRLAWASQSYAVLGAKIAVTSLTAAGMYWMLASHHERRVAKVLIARARRRGR